MTYFRDKASLPSLEYLSSRLIYDPQSGKLFWRNCNAMPKWWNTRFAGKEALISDNGEGYRQGRIDGINMLAHRVAWLLHTGDWPVDQIDHINGISSDNRAVNLRQATKSQNQHNKGATSLNSSGRKGVTWHKKTGKWSAKIKVRGKRVHLGYFSDLDSAGDAYVKASADLHGDFANTKAGGA